MISDLNGARVHCLTGGPAFDASLPVVVFLHGAGMDGTVWALQTRWFAHHGFAVLAPDFPAHGRSEGMPLATVDAMADWVARLLQCLDVRRAALVGHSMGSLVALATAKHHPELVDNLILIGTAAQMKVGPDLMAAARADSVDAFAMVNLWGHGARAGLGGAEVPGAWMAGSGQRLLEKCRPGVLASDLAACDAFKPLRIAGDIVSPTLILQGARDMMTPLKSARELASAMRHARLKEIEGAGHMLMVEEGGRVLSAIAAELAARRSVATPTATQPVGAPP